MFKKFYHIVLILFLGISVANTQETLDTLPQVFLIGNHDLAYNSMLAESPELLMNVCANDMDAAYGNWLGFLSALEKFAIEQDVDINGLKLWINVFWNGDGTIRHIAYYPKPNSRHMEYEYVTVLLRQFSEYYTSDLRHEKMFCHYGSASFPSFITQSRKVDK